MRPAQCHLSYRREFANVDYLPRRYWPSPQYADGFWLVVPGNHRIGGNAMTVILDGPVGLRGRIANVRNFQVDQQTVIGLLANIAVAKGGQRENWPAPILAGADSHCPKALADAIWQFQVFWKAQGVFHNIDGVCDPNGNTIRKMESLADGVPPHPAPIPAPNVHHERIRGTWQITNMWSLNLGEVGQLGAVEMEITQPDEKKFKMKGAGAGFGVSVDPVGWAKALKKLSELNPFGDKSAATIGKIIVALGKGAGFNIGDYFQIFSEKLGPLNVTGGRIIPNPINAMRGRPTAVSRQMLTLQGGVHPPFIIASVGAAFGGGMEGGVVFFDSLPGVGMLDAAAIGVYGSSGLSVKFGAGAQMMIYHNRGAFDA
jgi:hypothetical protein